MRLPLIIAISLLPTAVKAQSFGSALAHYAPPLDSNKWVHVPLVAYTCVSNVWRHPKTPTTSFTLELRYPEDSDFTTVILRSPKGQTLKRIATLLPARSQRRFTRET